MKKKGIYTELFKKKNMEWVLLALIAVVFTSAMTLLFKRATLEIPASIILLFVFGFGFIFYLFHVFITKTPIKVSPTIVWILIAAALLSYLGNLFMVKALGMAPNPAFAKAFVGLEFVIVGLAAVFLFGSQLTFPNMIGIVLTIVGLLLLTVKF